MGRGTREPVTTEELTSFIAYWQAEGKSFTMYSGNKNWRAACKSVGQQRRTAETRCEYGQ